MERYIEQLIDDLHQATLGMEPPHKLGEELEADASDELEDMYDVEVPISTITGIERVQLPPAEKLSQEQQALLSKELENFLSCFHVYLDFPKYFPTHLRYPFILNFWEDKHAVFSFGATLVDLCDYNKKNCPFPGYCFSCGDMDAEAWEKGQGMDDVERELDEIFVITENYDPAQDFAGFFNDDGMPIDPESTPVPSLCMVCKTFYIDDPEEKILCMMNRNDQRDDPDFICGVFVNL